MAAGAFATLGILATAVTLYGCAFLVNRADAARNTETALYQLSDDVESLNTLTRSEPGQRHLASTIAEINRLNGENQRDFARIAQAIDSTDLLRAARLAQENLPFLFAEVRARALGQEVAAQRADAKVEARTRAVDAMGSLLPHSGVSVPRMES